jgi:ketosteroid isomerase-like protein
MDSVETFHLFLQAINNHDVTTLTSLMAPDHLFIDSLGNRVQGAKAMESGWRGYFAMCPDYWIRADHVMSDGDLVLATGEAGGTIHGHAWKTPAAWKGTIRDGAVLDWQVFADNKPVYEILTSSSPKAQ